MKTYFRVGVYRLAYLSARSVAKLDTVMRNSRALGFRLIGTSMIQMDSLIRWRENNANDERVPAFMWSFGNLERWLKTPDHLSLLAKDTQMRVWRGWDTIRALDNRHGDIFARLEGPTAPRMSPIEMYGVFCLVTYWPGRRLARLAADIRSLRRDIRQAYKDLQSNNTVWKWIWNFIDYVIPINFGVAEDGSHERIPNPDEDEPAIQQARQYRLAKLTSLSLLGMSADQRIDVERTERERAGENIPVPPPSATDRGHRRTPASNSADRKRPASSPLERIAESSAVRKKSQRQSKPATLPGMPASAAQLSGIFDQAVAASSIHEPSKVQKRSRVTPPAASMQAASRSVPTPLHYLQSQDAELAVTPKNQARANRSSSSMKSSAGRRAMRPELVTPEAKAAARPNHDRQVPPPAPEPVGASTQRPTKRQPIFYNTFREARRNGPS